MPATKIATCCYCGTRAALVLRGETRHELSCAACGAPLHDLKSLPVKAAQKPGNATGRPAPRPHAPATRPGGPRRRKRKSLSRRILSEALDLIEDILD